jgi:hypothetical protein
MKIAGSKLSLKKQQFNLILTLIAVIIFGLLASNRLDAQGLYYDELHQAASSFAYIGRPPTLVASLTFRGIPIMNMNYSGAIKTAVYGIYMRFFDQQFGVISWRLVGILFVCAALLFFGYSLHKKISPLFLVFFFFLIISDITVLLTARHDWGPTALALSIRLIILGIWMYDELAPKPKISRTLLIASCLGFAVFEKLSAVVLLLPLILMLFSNRKRINKSHVLAFIIGGIIGAIPLILSNLYSFYIKREFISLQFSQVQKDLTIDAFFSLVKNNLSLGAGYGAQVFIFGNNPYSHFVMEGFLFSSLVIAGILLIALRFRPDNKQARIICIAFLAYFTIIIQLYFLPQNTWVHHWITGTPFQYIAISLLVSGAFEGRKDGYHVISRYLYMALFGIFGIVRISGMLSVVNSMARGITSPNYDISYTQIGEFAANNSDDAIFMAADWGVGTQILCFLNGDPSSLLLPNWKTNTVVDIVRPIMDSEKSVLYIIFPIPTTLVTSEEKQSILEEMDRNLEPTWQLQIIEDELLQMKALEIIKYTRNAALP